MQGMAVVRAEFPTLSSARTYEENWVSEKAGRSIACFRLMTKRCPFTAAGNRILSHGTRLPGERWLPRLFVLSSAHRRTEAQAESRMNLAEVQPRFRSGIVDVEVVL
jgi:hypothetical protein